MSKKEISRRDFIKGAAGAAGVAALGVLAGCAKTPEATPTPAGAPRRARPPPHPGDTEAFAFFTADAKARPDSGDRMCGRLFCVIDE